MSRDHVGHADIVRFADDRVNLKRDDAADLRAQANRLRDKLEGYLVEHPDFGLKKMLLSGSLAKGTSLKSISDIDVACYVASASAPHAIGDLIEWLAKRLETAFPNFKPSQITRKTFSVSVQFITTGNEVDIVPIFYDGDPQWRGDLISQDSGERLMTSIPLHLDFIRKRKAANPKHFAQVVRLIKFWAGLRKREDLSGNFRFKSFMIEMIVAHLADRGTALNDYPEALQSFFTYLATDQLRSVISFTDYYAAGTCKPTSEPIRIWDPVNCENNVTKLYNTTNQSLIVEAAIDAGDAIDAALRATSKGETIRYWQKVFGPSFDAWESEMSSYTSTETSSFTVTHARYIASKVATDLKRFQRFYGSPSDDLIDRYERELAGLLKHDAVDNVVYGFQRNSLWTPASVRYRAMPGGSLMADDDPGKIRPGIDVSGAKFTSFLSYSSTWWGLTQTERETIRGGLPINRSTGSSPDLEAGAWSDDLGYSAGGRGLGRSSVRI